MKKVYATFRDKGLVVLGVAIDRLPPPAMQQFLKQHQVPYPVVLDLRNQVAQLYGVPGTPTSYPINRAGKLVGGIVGPGNWHSPTASRLMLQLLGKAP